MKFRYGYVSNSSSSSFVVCERRDIKDREEMLEYLKSHESCVGYVDIDNGVYFDIEGELRDEILAHFDEVYEHFAISDGFQLCGEDGFQVTEDMVGCTVSITSGWDGYGCPCYLEYDERDYSGLYTDVLELLFENLPDDKGYEIINELTGNDSEGEEW